MTLAFLYLLDRVCAVCSVRREDVLSKRRTASVADARAVAVYCVGEFMSMSPAEMAPLFDRSRQNLEYLRDKVKNDGRLKGLAGKVLQ